MKSFEILYKDDAFAAECDGHHPCVRVVEYKDKAIRDIVINADQSITTSEKIKIKFEYPFTNPVIIEFNHKGGFKLIDFFKAIYNGYSNIYAMEDDPGLIPGMLNRARSNGPVGIWGHVIEDLFIEGIKEIDKDFFTLEIGS